MGIYGPSIQFPSFPAVLPSMALLVALENPGESFECFSVELAKPDGTPLFPRATGPAAQDLPPPPFVSNYQYKIFPVPFPEPGSYIVRFRFDTNDLIGIDRVLYVRRMPEGEISQASVAPSCD